MSPSEEKRQRSELQAIRERQIEDISSRLGVKRKTAERLRSSCQGLGALMDMGSRRTVCALCTSQSPELDLGVLRSVRKRSLRNPELERDCGHVKCTTQGCTFAANRYKSCSAEGGSGNFCCVHCRWIHEESEVTHKLPEDVIHGNECERIDFDPKAAACGGALLSCWQLALGVMSRAGA